MRRRTALIAGLLAVGGCAISTQQELQMGEQDAAQINSQLPIVQDAEVNNYINALGNSIAKLTSRGDLTWHFYVVNTDVVNAFAVPGGYIYVNRGVITRADKMDELAGVIGHEIGHVVKRHSVKQMQQMQAANVGVALTCVLTNVCKNQAAASAINVGGAAVFAKFSREDEKEADEEGFRNVVRAGISPEGLVSFFQKLLEEEKTKPSALDAWFSDHPLTQDRITDVQNLINQLPQQQLASLATDTQAFHAFKNRVASLPPPPPAPPQQQQPSP